MSAETKNSPADMFDVFWNAVLLDSKECNLSFLNEKHVPYEESREINFDKLENRLAYLYRFGNFNIHLSEKCITNFMEKYSEASHLFSRNNLKICSLSNGPGFDLVGLFKSIFKSDIRLKSVPNLKIISLFNTWWNVSHRLFTDFYEVIRPCYEENVRGPLIKVDGLVNDIYSEMSSEAKACIGDSDILLMFKVFYSSKATPEKSLDSMKEIFSLLKPGSFVFFLGSKTNTKELAENTELTSCVDCILGPVKISSDLQDEDVIKPAALQPRKSGYGYFVVWKKKGVVPEEQSTPKKKRTRRKNKLKNNEIVTVNDETNDSIDTQSEMSFNSCDEQFETSIDGHKSASCENLSTTGIKTKSKRKGLRKEVLKHLFCDSLYNLSDNSDTDSKTSTSLKDIAFNSKHFNELQTLSHANLFRSHSVMEISKNNLIKKHLNSSLSDLSLSVNSITSLFDKMQIQPTKAKSKSACSLDENHQAKNEGKHEAGKKDFNPAKFQDDLLRNIKVGQNLKVENIPCEISQDESKITKKSKKNKSQSMMIENSSVLSESVTENKMDKNMHNARAALENKMQSNSTISKECSSIEDKTLAKSHESKQDFNTLLQLKLKVQNISNEIPQDKSKSSKKNKSQSAMNEKSSVLSGLVTKNETDENTLNSKIAVENKMQSNLIQSKSCMCMEEKASNISDESNQDFKSLLQRCESLVTSLEKLTHSVERNITLRNDQNFRCRISGSCAEFKPLPVCASSCSVHSNCRKRNCNCHLCLKCYCSTSCTRINSCEASRANAYECSGEIVPKVVPNISSPYIVMPVTKEDILHILTSKNS